MKQIKITEITPIGSHYKEKIITLSNELIGFNYLTRGKLSIIRSDPGYILYTVHVKGIFAGFSLVKICKSEELINELFIDEFFLKRIFPDKKKIAIVRISALCKEFQGLGIWKKIEEYRFNSLKGKAESIIRIYWDKERALIKKNTDSYNYTILKEIPFYWSKDSIDKQYECQICGKPPCKCKALVLVKFLE